MSRLHQPAGGFTGGVMAWSEGDSKPGVGAPGGPAKPAKKSISQQLAEQAALEQAEAAARDAADPGVPAPEVAELSVNGHAVTLLMRLPKKAVKAYHVALTAAAGAQRAAMSQAHADFKTHAAYQRLVKCKADLSATEQLIEATVQKTKDLPELARLALENGEDPAPHERAAREATFDLESFRKRLPTLQDLVAAAERAAEDSLHAVMQAKADALGAANGQQRADAAQRIITAVADVLLPAALPCSLDYPSVNDFWALPS